MQGDIVGVLDGQGNSVVQYTYDIWGKLLSVTGTLASTIGEINPIRYRGYYYDTETELYYLQSRYYSPELMRFISQDDPVLSNDQGEPLGSNLYAYCLNNPVNSSDPTGSFGTPIQWAMAIIGGIAGWYFGDYVAKKLGYKSGWKYWAIRAGVVVGGAVIGWFAGTAIVKVATKFLLANPTVMAKLPGPVLWLLGLSNGGQLANELFQRYANHIFSSEHIKNGILKLGSSKRHIFDKIYSIIQSSMSKSVNGSNQIHTIINGHKVTIRFYLKDGVIKSMDAFTGWASRIIGNLIKK